MTGYTQLASFLTEKHHPIVRKYEQLAVRDLLYLQAELCQLDYEYATVAKRDSAAEDNRRFYDRDWLQLESSRRLGLDGDQWEIALEIRGKLREYYESVLQYSRIASLAEPKDEERDILNKWVESAACRIIGRDLSGEHQPSVYAAINQKDLAILGDQHGEDDMFTKFIRGPVLKNFHRVWKHTKEPLSMDLENQPVGDNRSNLHEYADSHVTAVTNLLGTVFSSVAPLVSIIVLSIVTNSRARLGLICAFTLLFSLCLALATKARRVEVFAATAAFASVQVVFIGGSNSTSLSN